MGKLLNHADVVKQSKAVFGQFGEKVWIPNARTNAALPHRPAEELRNIGLGRILVCAAMGESLETHIDTIKKYRDRFDLITCDKGFGKLIEQGIKPDAVLIADASIPFRWLAPYVAETEGVRLLATAYANTEWTEAWRGPRYFYCNADALDTQNIFLDILGRETRVIPAGSNVSNALICFTVGAMDNNEQSFCNYERTLLTGYDYSWRPDGRYYAFDDPRPKRFYMHHRTMLDLNGDIVHTSENLLFSAKWLWMYAKRYRLPMVNCSGRGILDVDLRGDLARELDRVNTDPATVARVRQTFDSARGAWAAYEREKRNFVSAKEAVWQ